MTFKELMKNYSAPNVPVCPFENILYILKIVSKEFNEVQNIILCATISFRFNDVSFDLREEYTEEEFVEFFKLLKKSTNRDLFYGCLWLKNGGRLEFDYFDCVWREYDIVEPPERLKRDTLCDTLAKMLKLKNKEFDLTWIKFNDGELIYNNYAFDFYLTFLDRKFKTFELIQKYIRCARIEIEEENGKELIIDLPINFTKEEFVKFLQELNINRYDSPANFASGTVWMKDKRFFNYEFNNNEDVYWKEIMIPAIPKELFS